MFEEINAAMQAETTDVVKLWMNWMMLIFFASIFFVRRHKAARWALAVIVATMIGAALIWHLTQNIHLFGIAHLVLWAPLAIYLWKTVLSKPARRDGQGGKPIL